MTSPRKPQGDPRSRCHGTSECWPVPDPAVARHAAVPGGYGEGGQCGKHHGHGRGRHRPHKGRLKGIMVQRILVLDKNEQPLMPCRPARARALLRAGKPAVSRRFPFTIILKGREGGAVQATRVKRDPGSKTTGLALVAAFSRRGPTVVWAGELTHRGYAVRKALTERRPHRRLRRSRLRYRAPRFDNRTRPKEWLAPSLQHRVDTTMAWVGRLMRWSPVATLSQELARFDTQTLQNPGISGIGYQLRNLVWLRDPGVSPGEVGPDLRLL